MPHPMAHAMADMATKKVVKSTLSKINAIYDPIKNIIANGQFLVNLGPFHYKCQVIAFTIKEKDVSTGAVVTTNFY